MSTRSDTVLLAAGLGVGQILVSLQYLAAARATTPEDFGTVAAMVALATVIANTIDWGGSNHALRIYSSGAMSGVGLRALTKGRLLWFSLAGATFWLFSAATHRASPHVQAGAAALLVTTAVVGPASIPWRVRGRFNLVAGTLVAARLPATGLMVAGASQGMDVSSWLPAALALSSTIEAVVAIRCWPKEPRGHTGVNWNPWRGTLKLGAGSAIIGLQSLDTPIIRASAGADAAGQYAAVNRWISPMAMLSTAFTQAIFPAMAQSRSAPDAMKKLATGWPFLALGALAAIAVTTFAEEITLALLGPAYIASADALRILAFATMLTMVNAPVYGMLIARHRDTAALAAIAVSIGVQLAAMWFLSARFGAIGGALGFLVGQTVALVLLAAAAVRSRDVA